jgi:hypothetical protein
MNLYKASNQWANRPADERFWTVEEMVQACLQYRQASAAATAAYGDLRVEARDGDLHLVGRTGIPARLTHWSFGQLSQRAGAPASYLRKLPATLTAQNINHGLKAHADGESVRLLLQRANGIESTMLRAITSERYTRIWNHEIGERLLDLVKGGWVIPPAMPVVYDHRMRVATVEDCGPYTYVKPGDTIAPAGVYASDHDMFVFLINPERQIHDGSPDGLFRGFFCWNSEVGAASFGVMAFLFKGVCHNHIVWGAEGVFELRIRHIGDADERAFRQLQVELNKYADSSASDIEAKIEASRKVVLGATKEEVVNELFGIARQRRVPVTLKALDSAYDVAVARSEDYGDPRTLWGMVNGLTEQSQELGFADKRVDADRAAGRLLEVCF